MPAALRWTFVFRRQGLHLLALTALLALAFVWPGPGALAGEWLGVSGRTWFAAAVVVPVAHQVYVWLAWRSELCWQSVTSTSGFATYRAVFVVLILLRPVTALGLAVADAGSLHTSGPLAWSLAALLAIPALWGAASTLRHFGITRAVGADHFDPAYRTTPFVRRWAFKYVPNAMYVLVFLAFWALALASGSQAAYALAFFSHAYIWVHYWCTERPDMDEIYGDGLDALRDGAS